MKNQIYKGFDLFITGYIQFIDGILSYKFNTKNIKTFVLLFIIFFTVSANQYLYSQKKQTIRYDTLNIEQREFSKEKIEDFKNNDDFNYEKDYKEPNSFVDKILFWIIRKIADISQEVNWNYIKIIMSILFISAITYMIYKTDIRSFFYRMKNKKDIKIFEIEENIDVNKLDSIIETEINDGNYRKAVRYLYLKLLKLLRDKEIIVWKINKTNKEYYIEITDTDYIKTFKKFTNTYEYIWYGNFSISEKKFQNIHSNFNKFYLEIDV